MTVYRCANCGRRLKEGRWVFSRYTRQRYCWAGACLGKKTRKKGEGARKGALVLVSSSTLEAEAPRGGFTRSGA